MQNYKSRKIDFAGDISIYYEARATPPCFCPDPVSFQLLKRTIFFFGRIIALLFRTCIHSQLSEEP